MEFIEIILDNSNLMEAKLYIAAQKAASNPEIGITIQNKAAYHVIKDCANITLSYLPHIVFGSYENPFKTLKGKIKKKQILEFIQQAKTSVSLNQLLDLILLKAEKLNLIPSKSITIEIDKTKNPSDPYGDYGVDLPNSSTIQEPIDSPLEILCIVFEAK